MRYRIVAYKAKVGSEITVENDRVPLGVFYEAGELYIVYLQPLEEKILPEEKLKESEEKPDGKGE